jgi:hypothetical protein
MLVSTSWYIFSPVLFNLQATETSKSNITFQKLDPISPHPQSYSPTNSYLLIFSSMSIPAQLCPSPHLPPAPALLFGSIFFIQMLISFHFFFLK